MKIKLKGKSTDAAMSQNSFELIFVLFLMRVVEHISV